MCHHSVNGRRCDNVWACRHTRGHTHKHWFGWVLGSYLQTWGWTCPCWQHTLPVTCSPGPGQSPAERLRDSPPGGKSVSWAQPLPISINLMPSHHAVAKMRCAKHWQRKECTLQGGRSLNKPAPALKWAVCLPAKVANSITEEGENKLVMVKTRG